MLALGVQRSSPLVTSLEDLGVERKDFEVVQGGSTFMELTDLHKKENRMQANVMERAAPGATLVLEESVEVSLPVSEVYQRWLDVEHYPEFMENVEAIRPLGGGRYHWIARLFGAKQEWDTEITDQQENQRIAWRSLDGPLQAGSVTLQPLPNNATLVRLRMESTPPGGVVGQRLEHLTHLSRRLLRRNLENFAHLVKEERTPGMGGVLAPRHPPAGERVGLSSGRWAAGWARRVSACTPTVSRPDASPLAPPAPHADRAAGSHRELAHHACQCRLSLHRGQLSPTGTGDQSDRRGAVYPHHSGSGDPGTLDEPARPETHAPWRDRQLGPDQCCWGFGDQFGAGPPAWAAERRAFHRPLGPDVPGGSAALSADQPGVGVSWP